MAGCGFEALFHQVWNVVQPRHQAHECGVVDASQSTTHVQGHGGQHRDLGGERLGARHANFRSCVGVGPRVRLTRDARPDHVAHPKDVGARLLGGPDGREGVRGFSALRNGQHHIGVADDGVSVSKFRSVFHLDRDACQALEEVFGDQPGVPACPTSQDEDALRVFPLRPMLVDAGQVGRALLEVDPSPDGVSDGAWLLVNLLQHEMVVPAFFQRGDFQFNGLDFWGDFRVTNGADGQFAVPGHRGDFFILQVHHILGVRHNGRGVRSHEEVVVASNADHEGLAFSGGHEAVWMRFVKHDDGVGPNHLFQGDAHRVGKVESCGGHDFLDEMRQHLGVGVAGQRVPTVRQQFFERLVILR